MRPIRRYSGPIFPWERTDTIASTIRYKAHRKISNLKLAQEVARERQLRNPKNQKEYWNIVQHTNLFHVKHF